MRLIKFNGTRKTICFSHYYTGYKNSCRHWYINFSIKLSRTCGLNHDVKFLDDIPWNKVIERNDAFITKF